MFSGAKWLLRGISAALRRNDQSGGQGATAYYPYRNGAEKEGWSGQCRARPDKGARLFTAGREKQRKGTRPRHRQPDGEAAQRSPRSPRQINPDPTEEVNLALNPGPEGIGTTGPASDRSNFERPEDAGRTSPPPAALPNASGPQRQRGQRPSGMSLISQAGKALQNTTRTGRKWTGREEADSVGPGRTREPVLTA